MFPFRKTPPTKAEVVKHRVARGLIDFGKKLDKTPVPEVHLPEIRLPEVRIPEIRLPEIDVEAMRRQAAEGARHVAQSANQALHEVSGKAEIMGGAARDRARDLAGSAGESAHRAFDAAGERAGRAANATSDAAQRAFGAAGDKASQAAAATSEAAQKALSAAGEKAGHAASATSDAAKAAAQRAGQAIHDAADTAGHAAKDATRQASDQAGQTFHDVAQSAGEAVGKLRNQASKTGEEASLALANPEVRISESGSKWLWVILGLLAGGFAALIFLPAAGRKSRAVRDRLDKVREGEADAAAAASDKAAELESRAGNSCDPVVQLAEGEAANDALLTDRVQSALGHLEALEHVEGLNLHIEKGVVVLRGVAPDEAHLHAIEAAARAVPGVRDVRCEFEIPKVAA